MQNESKIFMDHTAGRPVDERVVEAMLQYMKKDFGNVASIHSFGSEPRKALDDARTKIAELVNAEKDSVIFTSGATESNNIAIKGVANRSRDKRGIVASSIEHMSVMNPCKYLKTKGFELTLLPVDEYGFVDLGCLEKSLTDSTVLITTMLANGEIGTIERIKEISDIVHEKNAYLHVDGTAACGQIPIDVSRDGIDLLTLSSNDIYGPRGVGALCVKRGVPLEPLIHGGGQEKGLRSGTENVAGIVGFGKAAELVKEEMSTESVRLVKLRNRLIKGLLDNVPVSFLNGHPTERLPNNAAVRFSYIEGESILLNLDMLGIAASSGSACTAKTLEPSHVLLAIGLKHEEAHGSLLCTLGKSNTEQEVDYVINVMPDIVKRLREISPLTPKELQK
jgi:cysteine desulfurase